MTQSMSHLEESILACQDQDANLVRRLLARVWRFSTAANDPALDRNEAAKLACQVRDQAAMRESAASLGHVVRIEAARVSGAAHA